VFFRAASVDYPRVLGIPLVSGRWTTDDEKTPVVMVNETFVRLVCGKDEPLGQRLRIHNQNATIVGVVGDRKMSRLDATPQPEVLVPYKQTPVFRRLDVLVKTVATRRLCCRRSDAPSSNSTLRSRRTT
jgi:hypothetical protein